MCTFYLLVSINLTILRFIDVHYNCDASTDCIGTNIPDGLGHDKFNLMFHGCRWTVLFLANLIS